MAFPIGLGFVAGFIDIFGFMAWFGLLAAHVTGNLIFLAVDIARGDYSLVMKLLALPIFAASVGDHRETGGAGACRVFSHLFLDRGAGCGVDF